MNASFYILRELWSAVIEDYFFTLTILSWIAAIAYLRPFIHNGTWNALVLFIGLLAILLFSVACAFRPLAPPKTIDPIKS